jgi:hypothetical protein
MGNKALAKLEFSPNEAPDATRMRATIIRIIRSEFSGDVDSELWIKPARQAADRIINAVYGGRPGF